jgi:hypothetical protein
MSVILTSTALAIAIFGTWKYLQLYNDSNEVPAVDNGQINMTTPAKCMQIRDGIRCVSYEQRPCATQYTRSGHKMMKRPDYYIAHCENGQNVVTNCVPPKGEILTATAVTVRDNNYF